MSNVDISRITGFLLKIYDVVALLVCFAFALTFVRPDLGLTDFQEFLALRISVSNFALITIIVGFWHALFSACGLYRNLLGLGVVRLAIDTLMATLAGTVMIAVLAFVFDIGFVNPVFLLVFLIVVFGLSLVGHSLAAAYLRTRATNNVNRPRLLVVGLNLRSLGIAKEILSSSEYSYDLLGFADNDRSRVEELDKLGLELVTSVDNLACYVRQTPIDEVLLCLPLKSCYDEAANIVSLCEEQGITVRIMADLFQYKMTHSRAESFGGRSVITVGFHGMVGAPAFVKRLIDILGSATLLIALAPVFGLVATTIALTSSGPVFFTQRRVGLNKKPFRMIKFRSMVVEAEVRQGLLESMNEAAGPAFKIKEDPRVTRVGRFLRKSSIDELPQLVNVFRGEMSLVGPRPLPYRDYDGFTEDWHRRRVSVRPGMTGLWQVESRNHDCFDDWMRLDMRYIDEWSLLTDIRIMLRTIPAIIRGSGES